VNRLIPLYVTLSTFVHTRVEQLRERDDRGASAMEYGGLLALLLTIFTALFGLGLNNKVGNAFSTALGGIFKGIF
jgi:Flp pilus assembly pilin Flp